jgi:hypothetical protein
VRHGLADHVSEPSFFAILRLTRGRVNAIRQGGKFMRRGQS